jgi:hypothetical protein
MKRSPEELAQTERFEKSYSNLQSAALIAIGCFVFRIDGFTSVSYWPNLLKNSKIFSTEKLFSI